MQLNFGVIDFPYADVAASESVTTGDVAEILEAKYAIMENFADHYKKEIATMLSDSVSGALESLLMGKVPDLDVTAEAASAIKASFSHFLESREIEGYGIDGVPTKAALAGVSHRFRHPYAKGHPRRPSFIDTGTYESAFIVWVS